MRHINVATKVFYMDDKGIYESGTPVEIFENPKREQTKIFINKLKVFTGEYVVGDIDLYEVMRHITEYCSKYDMNKQETNHINLICEEYLTNIMKREMADIRITISVYYNEKDGSQIITFMDNFSARNHLESEDFDYMSARLIKGFANSLTYERADGLSILEIKLT